MRTTIRVCLALLSLTLCSVSASAKRFALVVGIEQYQNVPKLVGPAADADKLFTTFKALGFETTKIIDSGTDRAKLLLNWYKFLSKLTDQDDVVIYYSGHGVEIEGTNYLVPIDVMDPTNSAEEQALKDFLIPLQKLINDIVYSKKVKAAVWIVDACRDNPFQGDPTKSIVKSIGLGQASGLRGPTGTFIFYAANFGERALASIPASQPNSLYTWSLAKYITEHPDADVRKIAFDVRQVVFQTAKPHAQFPAYYDAMPDLWCFGSCGQQGMNASLQTISQKVFNPSIFEVHSAVSIDFPAAVDRTEGRTRSPNAVFLGKRSSLAYCELAKGSPSVDAAPFGCSLLEAIAMGRPKEFVGVPIAAQSIALVRQRVPSIASPPAGSYPCVVGTLKKGDVAVLSGVLDRSAGDDVSYWGTLASAPKNCAAEP